MYKNIATGITIAIVLVVHCIAYEPTNGGPRLSRKVEHWTLEPGNMRSSSIGGNRLCCCKKTFDANIGNFVLIVKNSIK